MNKKRRESLQLRNRMESNQLVVLRRVLDWTWRRRKKHTV